VNFESLFQAQKQAEAEQAAPKIVTAH
jgi:hypothetical protein